MVILRFFTVFHLDLQKYSFHNNKTVLQLYKNVVDDSKWLRERDKKVRVGKSERPGRKINFSYDSWTSFFSLCASSDAHSWSFRLLGGGRETPAYTKQRSLLCCSQQGEGGLEGGREMWKERCEDRNYEFSAWKVQVLLKVGVAIGINLLQSLCTAPSLWLTPLSHTDLRLPSYRHCSNPYHTSAV